MCKGYVRTLCFRLEDFLNYDVSPQAITRLTPREAYDRAFRFKRASQASVLHKDLPQSEWTKPEDVCHNLHVPPTSSSFSCLLRRMFGI